MKKTNKNPILRLTSDIYQFIRYDIWRITGTEMSKTKRLLFNSAKTLIVAIRGFTEDKLQTKASALTYYTLFALVPVLALILAIGRGFGFQDVIINSLGTQFSIQPTLMPYLLSFVDKYLTRVQGGVFVGIGVAILFWSVMSGFRQIERAFNDIWQVKKSKPFVVQFTTYFSLMLIFPVFIVASSGLSIFIVTQLSSLLANGIFGPFVSIAVKLSPFVINWMLFTSLFLIVPNTRVKFVPGLIAGIFTGTFFQIFQILYIRGQVFLTGYNAVYGSFAIIPLLLLWLQISWLIILLGAELSYAAQNISNFEYEADSQKISRRYKDFLTLLIVHMIVKRFENGEEPLSPEEISKENAIPIRLASTILNQLVELDVLSEIVDEKTKQKAYQPAIDIHKISISFLFDKVEKDGSENFKVDKEDKFSMLWKKLDKIKTDIRNMEGSTLIKDL